MSEGQFMLLWGLVAAPLGLVLAFDYRGAAQWFFRLAQSTSTDPGGTITPRFFQFLGGFFGVAGCVMLPIAIYKLLMG
ncbi:hypothetical protein [Streptodolium elevatio]